MKLLAAVDLSRASSYVVETALRVATATDAEVCLLHVVIPLPGMASAEFDPVTQYSEVAGRYLDEQDQLAELVRQLVEVGVNASSLIVQGDPVRAILSEARRMDAEFIVVGSHGRGLLLEALLGSISAGVLRGSTVPVLVVPTREL